MEADGAGRKDRAVISEVVADSGSELVWALDRKTAVALRQAWERRVGGASGSTRRALRKKCKQPVSRPGQWGIVRAASKQPPKS